MRLFLLVAAVLGTLPALGQIPDTFTNLQVIRKDIGRTELIATMRDMAGELGVRCAHCHVGPDDLRGMDFATDQKDVKKAAREMLKLVAAINGETLPKLPATPEPRRQVRCGTCHRGMMRPPRPLADELVEAASGGGASAVERLDALASEHGTAGRYDFRPQSVAVAIRRLAQAQKWEPALALAEANRARHPDTAPPLVIQGMALLAKGDRPSAARAFRRALEFDPASQEARRGLQEAEPSPSPTPQP